MAPHMMQTRRVATAGFVTGVGRRHGIETGIHLDVIEQRHPAMCQPVAVDGDALD